MYKTFKIISYITKGVELNGKIVFHKNNSFFFFSHGFSIKTFPATAVDYFNCLNWFTTWKRPKKIMVKLVFHKNHSFSFFFFSFLFHTIHFGVFVFWKLRELSRNLERWCWRGQKEKNLGIFLVLFGWQVREESQFEFWNRRNRSGEWDKNWVDFSKKSEMVAL